MARLNTTIDGGEGSGQKRQASSAISSHANREIPEELFPLKDRHILSPETISHLLEIPKHASMREILELACRAPELRRHVMRSDERTFFKDINLSKDVRWPLATVSPITSWEKVFLLAQMQLSGGEWPSTLHKARRKELMAEKKDIFRVLNRIIRCTIDIVGSKKDGEGTGCGLELLRCLEAGVWELQGVEIRQVVSIGPKMGAKLAEAGITTTKALAKMESWNMQRVMGKNVPFATAMFHRMKAFPILAMDVTQAGRLPEDEGVVVIKASLRYENKQVPTWKGLDVRVVFWAERESDKTLVYFWRRKIRRLEGTNGVDVIFGAGLPAAEYVRCYFSCEEVVGTIVQQTIQVS